MSGIAPATPKTTAIRGRKPATRKGRGKKTVKAVTAPSRTKTPMNQGIYIPSSRVKHFLDTAGLNKGVEDAIAELRGAEPHEVKITTQETSTKTGKKKDVDTGKTLITGLIAWNSISETTRNLVGVAKTTNEEHEKKMLLTKKQSADKAAEKLAKNIKDGVIIPAKLKAQQAAAEAAADLEEATRLAEREARAAKLAADIKAGVVDAKKHPVRGPKKPTKYSHEIELLSKMRVRFAKDASLQVASTICAFVHERTEFAIANCIRGELKIVKTKHAIEKGHDLLPFSSLIRPLDSYKLAIVDEAARVIDEARRKEEKKAEKKAKKDGEADTLVAEAVAPAAADDDDDDDEKSESSFSHYIRQVCNNIMNEKTKGWVSKSKDKHPWDEIRMSYEYKKWMSDIVIEFLHRFCRLLNGEIRRLNIRTVSRDIVMLPINIILGHAGVDDVKANDLFDSKFKLYQSYSKTRKEEKVVAAAARDAAAKVAAAGNQAATEDDGSEAEDEEKKDDDVESDDDVVPVDAPKSRRKSPA